MKNLFLIRHAKSSWDNMSLADHDRPLNKRGKRDAPRMANFLDERGVKPDLLCSSTAKRALNTAKVFSMQFSCPIDLRPQMYEASTQDILQIIQQMPDDRKEALLFGHNPGITFFVNQCQGAYIDNVPTCGIVHLVSDVDNWINFDPSSAKIVTFLYPKMFSY